MLVIIHDLIRVPIVEDRQADAALADFRQIGQQRGLVAFATETTQSFFQRLAGGDRDAFARSPREIIS